MKGDTEKLLVSILSGSRDETDRVDVSKAKQQAQDLYKAGQWVNVLIARVGCSNTGEFVYVHSF